MRHVAHWLIGIGVVTALGAGATTSFAQPNERDHRTPNPPPPAAERDHRRQPPPAQPVQQVPPAQPAPPAQGDYPREAPPPPREENMAPRAGFVWVAGRWDWRKGKWDWVAGHWEREHAGKQWNPGRWDRQGDRWSYVEGSWGDLRSPPFTPPPPGDPDHGDRRDRDDHGDRRDRDDRGEHHREWKLDRPMVSSYWPTKGKIGSRIVIHGRNFPADTVVSWGGMQVTGAKVGPDEIVVAVPPGATSGMIALRAGRGRELAVGNYEVADYDADAEARRVADEARKRAEQDWAARQSALAKDLAARRAEMERHRQELNDSREQRREQRLQEIRAKWEAAFLGDPDTQSELTLHAQRGAELARMREVAELSENGKLVIRIGVAQSREDQRHQDRMSALHDAFGGRKP